MLKQAFILFVLTLSFTGLSQQESTDFDKLKIQMIKKSSGLRKKIKKTDYVILHLADNESLIEGELDYISDSTITVNNASINLSDIEVIEWKRKNQTRTGVILAVLGVGVAASGIYVISETSESNGLGQLFGLFVGGSMTVAGTCLAAFGSIITIDSQRKYDLDEWDMEVVSP